MAECHRLSWEECRWEHCEEPSGPASRIPHSWTCCLLSKTQNVLLLPPSLCAFKKRKKKALMFESRKKKINVYTLKHSTLGRTKDSKVLSWNGIYVCWNKRVLVTFPSFRPLEGNYRLKSAQCNGYETKEVSSIKYCALGFIFYAINI